MTTRQSMTLEDAVAAARRDVAYKRERLVSAAQEIAVSMTRLVAAIQAGRTINSLGELQGQGPQLDIRCAEYAMAQEHLAAIERLAARLAEGSE